jgi:hypothetical protein
MARFISESDLARLRAEKLRDECNAPAKVARHVAFKVSFTIPNFDEGGDLNDHCVYINAHRGRDVRTAEQAIKWFRATYHWADQATGIKCEEGTVDIARFTMVIGPNGKPERWETVSLWKPFEPPFPM